VRRRLALGVLAIVGAAAVVLVLAVRRGGPAAPPPPVRIAAGGQRLPDGVRYLLGRLPQLQRPAEPGTLRVAASIPLSRGGRPAGRRLALLVYRTADGGCATASYITAVGSFRYGGSGLSGTGCGDTPLAIRGRSARGWPMLIAGTVAASADYVRLRFRDGSVASYRVGPLVAGYRRRAFLLEADRDPRSATLVRGRLALATEPLG
jgi:hypothetical protein